MAIIYIVTNSVNNKVYIGKTIKTLKQRQRSHNAAVKRGVKTHFYDAIRKYGENVFEWDVLEEILDDQASDAEIFWIAYFKYIGVDLYNHTIGGEGVVGNKWSEESRKRQSERYKGKPSGRLGIKWSEESRAKLRGNRNGKPGRSEEFRASIGRMFAKTFYLTLIAPDGTEHSDIYNLSAFCRKHNIAEHGIKRVIYTDQKQYKGWKLKK